MITVGSSLRRGVDALVRRFPQLLGAWLLILAVQQVVQICVPDSLFWLETLLLIVLLPPLYAGQYALALHAVRGETVTFRAFFVGYRRFGCLVVVSFLTGLLVVIGSFLFVVPGIVWAMTFAFAPIIVVEDLREASDLGRIGPIEAMKESAQVVRGYRGKLFGISLLLSIPTIVIGILASIKLQVPTFGLPDWVLQVFALLSGTLFLGPLHATSYMSVYDAITGLAADPLPPADPNSAYEPPAAA